MSLFVHRKTEVSKLMCKNNKHSKYMQYLVLGRFLSKSVLSPFELFAFSEFPVYAQQELHVVSVY